MRWICEVRRRKHEGQKPPDGCPTCGVDSDKFLALGATAVMIGRDAIRAAIGGGSAGVRMQMERLGSVLKKGMLMTGCPDLDSIDRSILR